MTTVSACLHSLRRFPCSERAPFSAQALLQKARASPECIKCPAIISIQRQLAPGARAGWQQAIDACRGRSWVDIPWNVAESMFYLRLCFATGCFDPRSPWFRRDPFEPMKARELKAISRRGRQGPAPATQGKA